MAAQNVTVFGTNPAYIQFAQTVGYKPENLEFAVLRSVLSTGSILHPSQFDWIVRHVKRVPVQSISGGTDIIGCFVLGNPNLPVYRGKLQCTSLGLDVRSVPPEAQVGDLVCVNPFQSRPTGIFGDDEGTRYHEAYFTQNPGIWTHGDLIELTEHGAIMHGRFDLVMNIRGVRVGPAEIYRILREIPAIVEAMAVEQLHPAEPGGVRLILLVVLRSQVTLDTDLIIQIRTMLADQGHVTMVPAAIVQVPELPVTFNSKLSEAAARDAVNNRPIRNRAALRNPDCLTGLWEKIEQSDIDIRAVFDTADMERSLCQLCQRYLRVPVHPSDNFLALGGDSITILSFLLDVADKAPVKVPFPMLIGVSTGNCSTHPLVGIMH